MTTVIAVAATAGCGIGPGESEEGTATLAVTRDYGAETLREATISDPSESETVLRALDREADITTRYGGGFVQSIDGIEGDDAGGRVTDWFFFVNGIESSTGSAEVAVHPGDRIWWDYRDWTEALRTPAVVGSWPEPFVNTPVDIRCFEASACDQTRETLEDAGADLSTAPNAESPRVLVGTWDDVREDRLASTIEDGPGVSGVFARFEAVDGGWRVVALDDHGDARLGYGEDAGLVAALRDGENPPTWVVTGTDPDGVDRAVQALSTEALTNRYAVALSGGTVTAVPVP